MTLTVFMATMVSTVQNQSCVLHILRMRMRARRTFRPQLLFAPEEERTIMQISSALRMGVLQRKSEYLGGRGSVGITMLCHGSLPVATFVINPVSPASSSSSSSSSSPTHFPLASRFFHFLFIIIIGALLHYRFTSSSSLVFLFIALIGVSSTLSLSTCSS